MGCSKLPLILSVFQIAPGQIRAPPSSPGYPGPPGVDKVQQLGQGGVAHRLEHYPGSGGLGQVGREHGAEVGRGGRQHAAVSQERARRGNRRGF